MMTENEFKLHMSVYLDRQMQPVLRHVKELENRLHRVEALLEGNVSPAFPYV